MQPVGHKSQRKCCLSRNHTVGKSEPARPGCYQPAPTPGELHNSLSSLLPPVYASSAMTPLPEIAPAEAKVSPPRLALTRSGLFRFSVARFLVALVLLFFSAPFLEHFQNGPLMETVLATLVMCMGVFAVGARRRILVEAIILAMPAVVVSWTHHLWPAHFPLEAVLAARLVFLAFVVARLLTFILRAPKVDSEVLCAGVSVYLLMGLVWTLAYLLVAGQDPKAFAFSAPQDSPLGMTRFNAFYYSFMTLTTVGYGDITPVSKVARMLAVMESMSGTLFVGVLIARLVSLYSAPSRAEAPRQE
jgi:voltage-gated potassium channel